MSEYSFPYQLTKICSLGGHTERVWCCAWSPGGTALATCGSDKTIRVWKKKTPISPNNTLDDTTSGFPTAIITGQTFSDLNLSSTQRTTLVEVGVDGKDAANVQHIPEGSPISLNDWICIQVLDDVHTRSIRSIAWSPSGRHIASASFDHSIVIWELIDGVFECVAVLKGHENEVKSVSWSGSGEMIVTCSRDKTVWVWQNDGDNDWECISVLTGHTGDVKAVKFNPHTDDIISCSYDDTIRFWSMTDDDWYNLNTLAEASSTVWDFAFDKSFHYLASVGDDKMLRVYRKNVKQVHEEDSLALLDAPSNDPGDGDYHGADRDWILDFTIPAGDRAIYSVDWSHQFQPLQEHNPSQLEQQYTIYKTSTKRYFLGLSHLYGFISVANGDNDLLFFELLREIVNPIDIQYIEADMVTRGEMTGYSYGLNDLTLQVVGTIDEEKLGFSKKYRQSSTSSADPSSSVDQKSLEPSLDALFNPDNHQVDGIISCYRMENAHLSDVNCIRFNPKVANLIATAGDDAQVHLWRYVRQ